MTPVEPDATLILPIDAADLDHESPTEIIPDRSDPYDLRPNKFRSISIFLLFLLVATWCCLNVYNLLTEKNDMPYAAAGRDGVLRVTAPQLFYDDKVRMGDEVIQIDGKVLDGFNRFRLYVRQLDPGVPHAFTFRRDGEIFAREITPRPPGMDHFLNTLENGILTPAILIVTALFLFLFKPNNKLTLLATIAFLLCAMSMSPIHFVIFEETSIGLASLWLVGYLLSLLNAVALLNFFIFFPQPLRLVKRFPKLEFAIYLPFLLYVIPTEIGQQLAWNGFAAFNVFYTTPLFLGDMFYPVYNVACIGALVSNYRDADELGKRRLFFLAITIPIIFAPFILIQLVLPWVESLVGQAVFVAGIWRDFAGNIFYILAPPVFAYAVIRHRVIPISFIIRLGLRYLFAKNGLRLMVLLPVAGIIWNIVTDPNRTLPEILLRNSAFFYLCVALAVGIAMLSRFRLNEWIDKRFFRAQYDGEHLLRNLIERVKSSDSIGTLSRLVSDQIEAAMHPVCIYFFFEDTRNSTFSLSYSTGSNSIKAKLPADSALLDTMRHQESAVEIQSLVIDQIPRDEREWLTRIDANLVVPMHGTNGKLAGLFVLGKKLSETAYTAREKELLLAVANQVAIVNENLVLRDRMRSDQRIRHEVLSRLDESNINLLKECPRCGRCFDRCDDRCPTDGAELTFTLPVERTIENRYRLDKLLGRGGMGAVYEASDLRINRTVALKILSGSLFGNREAQRRFEREAHIAGKLNHRNIVTVFDYGSLSTEGAFLVMEKIHGSTLASILTQKGNLDARTMVEWIGQMLDGVDAAHQAGIIHRDLKPENVFVTQQDDGLVRVCILDFGLARLNENEFANSVTVPGTVLGTLGYMPPEQLHGEKVNERGDLFSIGVIGFECLYGKRPYAGRTYRELLQSMTVRPVFKDDDPFAAFFLQSLAHDPNVRFPSAREMKRALTTLTIR